MTPATTSAHQPAPACRADSWQQLPLHARLQHGHDLTTFTTPGGRGWTATYNLPTTASRRETDGCGNQTSYTYTSSQHDDHGRQQPCGHPQLRLWPPEQRSGQQQPFRVTTPTTPATTRPHVQNQRGKNWSLHLRQPRAIRSPATDPLSNVTTFTYNSHNKVLTVTDALTQSRPPTPTTAATTADEYGRPQPPDELRYDVQWQRLARSITDPLSQSPRWATMRMATAPASTDANPTQPRSASTAWAGRQAQRTL